MQRLLSAVVLSCVAALASAPALAQVRPTGIPKPGAAAADAGKAAPIGGAGANQKTSPHDEAHLSDEAQLSRIVGLYEAGKYTACSDEIERLLDPTGKRQLRQPASIENARVYWAACLIGGGQAEQADAPLRAAIHENPQMKPPDSLVFPPPVVERFLRVRDSLVTEIRAAEQARIKQAQQEARERQQLLARDRDRLRELEALARQQLVVVQNRRVLSFVPFGVGQLQNRQETLGYTLMASELLLGGLSIAAIAVQSHVATDARDQAAQGNSLDNSELLSAWGVVKRVSFWSFAALAVGGVVQAQLAYVPEFHETRTRTLPGAPKEPRASASLGLAPYVDAKGGGLALGGRF
jgi:hypothetical protein